MSSPALLYSSYSENPCNGSAGAGTPIDLTKIAIFLKYLKHPCLKYVPGYAAIRASNWRGKIALPYKFLEILDPFLFTEVQPDIVSGTAHAIRNAADVSRACSLISRKEHEKWRTRGATEYMTGLGGNSFTDCFMMTGPNIVSSTISENRGTGCISSQMDCLPSCGVSKCNEGAALGAGFSCQPKTNGPGKECSPCRDCPEDENVAANDPCCTATTCEQKLIHCCDDPVADNTSYMFSSPSLTFNHNQFANPNHAGKRFGANDNTSTIKHCGYFLREEYGGYANFKNRSDKLWSCPTDIFLKFSQSINGYNYATNSSLNTNSLLDRIKTISYIGHNTLLAVDDIKALIYNGYGVFLASNIGFSNKRDSRGLSYPDRIWYHSYAIVGYDDSKTQFNECVYVLANSWGDWNSGGNPIWGKLPTGCFLVLESHLKKMLTLERIDKKNCRKKTVLRPHPDPALRLAGLGATQEVEPSCTEDHSCVPWECDKYQRPMGLAFALCFEELLQVRNLDYDQFLPHYSSVNKELIFRTNSSRVSVLNDDPISVTGDLTSGEYSFDTKDISYNTQENILYHNFIEKEITTDTNFAHTIAHSGLVVTNTKYWSVYAPFVNLNGGQVSACFISTDIFKANSVSFNASGCNQLLREARIQCSTFSLQSSNMSNINIYSDSGCFISSSQLNNCTIFNSDVLLQSSTLTNSTIQNNAILRGSTIASGSLIQLNTVLLDGSTNNGIIEGAAYFKNSSNQGTVMGDAVFDGVDANNNGRVFGRTKFVNREETEE